jgi:hypothetical protein
MKTSAFPMFGVDTLNRRVRCVPPSNPPSIAVHPVGENVSSYTTHDDAMRF